MHSLDDTIAAIATAPGGAARGIVRISGPDAVATVQKFFSPPVATDLAALRAATRIPGAVSLTLADSDAVRSLPCDLYLWPTQRSYTRQPVAEWHTFGSPPLLDALLRAACAAGARLAEPGEFTLRAFLAGRIDLMQAEAVLGVIDAADRRQLDAALAQLAGGLTRPLNSLRDQLLDLLADLEAGLDFVEEDIRFLATDELERRLSAAADGVAVLLEQMRGREQSHVAPRVVLAGWPNVGKSSLFNTLVGSEANKLTGAEALVSPVAGTTRDYLSAQLQLDGLSIQLIDTAGLEGNDESGVISAAAQQMAREQHEQADLRLLCLDSTRPLNEWEQTEVSRGARQLVVLTKCDLPTALSHPAEAIRTSTISAHGLDAVRWAIRAQLVAAPADANPSVVVAATAIRCRESLRLAAASVARARDIAIARTGEELIAAEVRVALLELGKVVGAIYSDDLLDRIFSRFCIGK